MRKFTVVAGLAVMAAGMAAAQTWQNDEGTLRLSLQGCVRQTNGYVVCTTNWNYTGASNEATLDMSHNGAFVVTADGKQSGPANMIAGSQQISSPYVRYDVNAFRGIPLKVDYVFSYPTSQTSIRLLLLPYGGRIENVALRRPGQAAVTPAPSAGVTLGTTQAVLGGKAFTISMTNCKLNAGKYTCTGTATPSR